MRFLYSTTEVKLVEYINNDYIENMKIRKKIYVCMIHSGAFVSCFFLRKKQNILLE